MDKMTLERAARELLDAMETCHACRGTVLVEEGLVHCEDCPSGCEHHDPPDCPGIDTLHRQLKDALAEQAITQPRLIPVTESGVEVTPQSVRKIADWLERNDVYTRFGAGLFYDPKPMLRAIADYLEAQPRLQCADPSALVVNCVVCKRQVHTCERAVAVKSDYRCPTHPDGVQVEPAGWACSEHCYDTYLELEQLRQQTQPRPTLPEALRDIPALLELCTRATPGPWDAENEQNTREKDAFIKITDPNNKRICDTFNADGQEIHSEADEDGVYYFEGGQRSKDMNFIAAARTALPAALEYIQALERKGDL